jgi:hypothetical protein
MNYDYEATYLDSPDAEAWPTDSNRKTFTNHRTPTMPNRAGAAVRRRP